MSETRARKMAELIKEEVSEIINTKLKDPRVGFTTVTSVQTSKDLRYCTVNVSVLGDEEQQQQTMETLHSAAGFIRSELGTRIRIRHVPEVRFAQDRAMEYHAHINQLLKEAKRGNDNGEQEQ